MYTPASSRVRLARMARNTSGVLHRGSQATMNEMLSEKHIDATAMMRIAENGICTPATGYAYNTWITVTNPSIALLKPLSLFIPDGETTTNHRKGVAKLMSAWSKKNWEEKRTLAAERNATPTAKLNLSSVSIFSLARLVLV